MSELHPFLLVPNFRECVWGARDLSPVYSRVVDGAPIGEVWLTGDDCKIASGPFKGVTLSDLCKRFGAELVGDAARERDRFPLLIKFLFPKQKLSVQVHPDDESARKLGQPCGKNECWYIHRAMAGAQVGLGLKRGTTREQLESAIRETCAENLLNWLDVKAGDTIYVDAGTVHAIGPGSIIVETQQNSDVTFRLYDYGRPRELHVREGLAATREETQAGRIELQEIDGHKLLLSSPCFVVEKFESAESITITAETGRSSAQVLVVLDGCGEVESEGAQPVSVNRGQALVIPASQSQIRLRPQQEIEFLRMRLPAEAIDVPWHWTDP